MGNKNDNLFNLGRNISSGFVFFIVMALSLLVAWYSLSAADEIIKNAEDSATFNVQKRVIPESVNK